ncbi:alpha/beta hydrolase [Kibdelosporangium philippinense]|uniref:alpha/beta hydrolase n=1 Tax=Kibdelosporangium philippinense TaxID=211113 RepID=UPI0035F0B850
MITSLLMGLAAVPAAAAGTTWTPCPDLPLECATVSVPLDYRQPAGRKIDIAVTRKKAAKPRGVLLLNPGGPGGRGRDMPLAVEQVAPPALVEAYDLIGFDPRGTGRSAPVSCGLTPEQTDMTKMLGYPAANGDIRVSADYARQIAKQCFQHSGDLLPHVTTANTARDMDRIRVALGERKISYFGTSYGSYLGAVYASLFPAQTDRFLLDSVLDPRDLWAGTWRNWGPGIEQRFDDFAVWAAAWNSTYGLGSTPSAVRDTYFALTAQLDARPVGGLTGNQLRVQTRMGLWFSDAEFPGLAKIWQSIKNGEPVQVPEAPMDQDVVATLWGISCNDVAASRNVAEYQLDVLADRKKNPISNGMPANIRPCAFWPVEPYEPAVRITDRGPSNIVLTQNLRDPATPLVGAQAMRSLLGNRSRLVTGDDGGHGAYLTNGNTCLDTAGTDFLVHGKFPAQDVHCGPA